MATPLLSLCLFAAQAHAGSLAHLDAAVHDVLDEDRGWVLHRNEDSDGISVFSKEVPGLGLTAFKGIKVLDPTLSAQQMFDLLADISGHAAFSPLVVEGQLVEQSGDTLVYYQVIQPPAFVPGSHRFWINTGQLHRDVGGESGHLKRAWSAAVSTTQVALRAELSARYPHAVEVSVSHGSWEFDPQDDGTVLYIYRTVSHPGGSVPDAFVDLVTSRTVPNNMMTFENAARGK